jgi:hypothetical protein
MTAKPIIPGRLYVVIHNGQRHKIIAANAAHAITVLLDLMRDNALKNWRTTL